MDAGNAIIQARGLYKTYHKCKNQISDNELRQSEDDIKRFIYIGIKEITPLTHLFHYLVILDILKQALKKRALNNLDVQPIGKAFDNLELYFILLVEQPWKPEFKVLKMYGGFYRTKIRSVLLKPEAIFKVAGYELNEKKNVLEIKKPVQRDTLLTLAFDCRVAASECRKIEVHYNKLKSLDKTVADAISDVLQDPSFSELSSSSSQKPIILRGGGRVVGPPEVVPNRKPLVNGSADHLLLQNSWKATGMPHRIVADSTNYSPPPPPAPLVTEQQVPDGGPILDLPGQPSAVVDDAYLLFRDTEVLPVLPEGTTEDHMRESLKFMENHQKSSRHMDMTVSEPSSRNLPAYVDIWRYGPSPMLTVPEGSHPHSALTYPPGFVHSKNWAQFTNANPSLDEGLGSDTSTMLRPRQVTVSNPSKNYRPSPVQSVLPNKAHLLNSDQASLVDQGYRSASRSDTSNYQPAPTNGYLSRPVISGVPYRTISRPPVIDTDGVYDPALLKVQVRGATRQAPPIPPRELKPVSRQFNYNLAMDFVDGAEPDLSASTQGVTADVNVNVNGVLRRDGNSLGGLNGHAASTDHFGTGPVTGSGPQPSPSIPDREPNLHRSRVSSAGRCGGSLKTPDAKSHPTQVMAQSRETRSMDLMYAQWQCQHCTALNLASDKVCLVCSRSQHGADEHGQTSVVESHKTCRACTFANSLDKTHCEICSAKLPDVDFGYMM